MHPIPSHMLIIYSILVPDKNPVIRSKKNVCLVSVLEPRKDNNFSENSVALEGSPLTLNLLFSLMLNVQRCSLFLNSITYFLSFFMYLPLDSYLNFGVFYQVRYECAPAPFSTSVCFCMVVYIPVSILKRTLYNSMGKC